MQRIRSMAEKVKASRTFGWVTGADTAPDTPWLLYLSPTNYCNLRCAVCARHETMRKDRGFMTLQTLQTILPKLPDSISKIYFQKQGEPLMNPDIVEIIRQTRQRFPNARLHMHTNGILMTPELAQELVPLLDFVAFSISGITEDVYSACHGRPRMQRALDGLQAFLQVRRDMERWDSNVVIDYVHQQGNRSETEERVAAFFRSHYPGLNSVDFHWTDSFQDSIEEASLNMHQQLDETSFPRCVFPWSAFTVLHDGRTDYCFVEPSENVLWPSLLEHDFDYCWNGPQATAFRAAMVAGKFKEMEQQGFGCRRCAWLWSTQAQRPDLLGIDYDKQSPLMEDIIPADAEDLGILALKEFEMGRFPAALGHLDWALSQTEDDALQTLLNEWKEHCHRALKQCWPRPDWVEALARKGRHPADMRARYERFGYGLELAKQVKSLDNEPGNDKER